MKGETSIRAADVMREHTIHVRVSGLGALRVRLHLASWVFRLGARILGSPLDVSLEPRQ